MVLFYEILKNMNLNEVFSYVLISHLDSTLFIWKKGQLIRLLFIRIIHVGPGRVQIITILSEIDVSSFGGEINWISVLDRFFPFVISELDWKFRSINKFAECIRLIKLAISIPSIINFLNNPGAQSWGKVNKPSIIKCNVTTS